MKRHSKRLRALLTVCITAITLTILTLFAASAEEQTYSPAVIHEDENASNGFVEDGEQNAEVTDSDKGEDKTEGESYASDTIPDENDSDITDNAYAEKNDPSAKEEVSIGGAADPIEPKEESKNPFEIFYCAFIDHSTGIFSALSLVVGLIVAFLCKRGLIPGIRKVGAALKSSVDKVAQSNERLERCNEQTRELTESGLTEIDGRIKELGADLGAIREQLDLADPKSERELFRQVLLMEIDLLYTVFISSSLPVYQKEELYNRINVMKKALGENE